MQPSPTRGNTAPPAPPSSVLLLGNYRPTLVAGSIALIALGMCFVIITGGIDISVGAVAALASVVAAHLSGYGLVQGVVCGVATGLAVGLLNAAIITKMRILPFIATLATMLAANGAALLLGDNQSVSVSYDTAFTSFGQGDLLGIGVVAGVLSPVSAGGEASRTGRKP